MLLTVKQFSTNYKTPIKTLYNHIESGILPYQKVGSTYLLDSDDFAKYRENLGLLDKEKERIGGKPRSTNIS